MIIELCYVYGRGAVVDLTTNLVAMELITSVDGHTHNGASRGLFRHNNPESIPSQSHRSIVPLLHRSIVRLLHRSIAPFLHQCNGGLRRFLVHFKQYIIADDVSTSVGDAPHVLRGGLWGVEQSCPYM